MNNFGLDEACIVDLNVDSTPFLETYLRRSWGAESVKERGKSCDELTAPKVALRRMLYNARLPHVTPKTDNPHCIQRTWRTFGHLLASVTWRPDPSIARITETVLVTMRLWQGPAANLLETKTLTVNTCVHNLEKVAYKHKLLTTKS
jgi:hypothetical protein